MVASLAEISAAAIVPDQLLPYARAVSGLKSEVLGECLLHYGAGQGVLVGYPLRDPQNTAALEAAVELALKLDLERLAVLAADIPGQAPQDAECKRDFYWQIPLPLKEHGQKLRNMLKRAGRELEISQSAGKGAWTEGHASLARDLCGRKNLDAGTEYLFGKLGEYLENAPEAILFSARAADGSLAACAIADYTAFETAFYMFAFRSIKAPPGAADLLLWAIAREGMERGHSRLNLGLGIDSGVEFFKRKWEAEKFLPCVETAWNPRKTRKGWLARLFGKKAE